MPGSSGRSSTSSPFSASSRTLVALCISTVSSPMLTYLSSFPWTCAACGTPSGGYPRWPTCRWCCPGTCRNSAPRREPGLIDLFVDDPAPPAWRNRAVAVHGPAVEAAPAPPEDHRHDETDHTHDHEDEAHGVDVEPGCADGYGEIQDRPDSDHE